MVFAPFIYLAHAVCLASPDCADNDNGTFSRLGGWLKKGRGGHQIAVQIHNEGGAIKQCHTSKVKVHESDKKRKKEKKDRKRHLGIHTFLVTVYLHNSRYVVYRA